MAPVGWYPDPSGTAWVRYWSGKEWTAWISVNGTVANDGRGAQTPPPTAPPSSFVPPPSGPSIPTDPPGTITFGAKQQPSVSFPVDPTSTSLVQPGDSSTIVFKGPPQSTLKLNNEGFDRRGCLVAPAILIGGGFAYLLIIGVLGVILFLVDLML